jgi:Domain of unknown function (DUF4352)
MRCAKHNEETSVTCGRCETPVCPRCMVHSDVGVRCKTCAPVQTRPLSERLPLLGGGVGSILAIILVVALIGTGGSLLAGGGADDPMDFYDDYLQNYEEGGDVTVGEVVDPWTPEDGDSVPSGEARLIAIEVLVEADSSSDLGYYATPYEFQLKDEESFVYGPVTYDQPQAQPALPDVSLQPGEKAQGWVTFEVPEDSDIRTLEVGTKEIELP